MLKVRKYFYIAKTSLTDGLVYIMDVFGRTFFFAFIISVYLLLWKKIYGNEDALLDGFNLQKMIWYLIITEIITLSGTRIYQEVSADVKSGNIAYLLNKPYNYVAYTFFNSIGKIFLAMMINTTVGLIIGCISVGRIPTFKLYTVPFIAICILLGLALDFFINFALALTAFWVEENTPFRWIYQKLVFTLGGMLLPLDLFPDALEFIAKRLPFASVTYGPGKVGVDFSFGLFGEIIIVQIGYLILTILCCVFIYKRGVRVLNVNGG